MSVRLNMLWMYRLLFVFLLCYALNTPLLHLGCEQIIGYRACLYSTSALPLLCRIIRRHWTYKVPVMYIVWNVSKIISQFFQLCFMHYMGLWVLRLPISPEMINNHRLGSSQSVLYVLLCSRDPMILGSCFEITSGDSYIWAPFY